MLPQRLSVFVWEVCSRKCSLIDWGGTDTLFLSWIWRQPWPETKMFSSRAGSALHRDRERVSIDWEVLSHVNTPAASSETDFVNGRRKVGYFLFAMRINPTWYTSLNTNTQKLRINCTMTYNGKRNINFDIIFKNRNIYFRTFYFNKAKQKLKYVYQSVWCSVTVFLPLIITEVLVNNAA